MTVYTYSEARQNLASLLDSAVAGSEVVIRRRDGQMFTLRPIIEAQSALDVGSIDVDIARDDILSAIRDSRTRLGEGQASTLAPKQRTLKFAK